VNLLPALLNEAFTISPVPLREMLSILWGVEIRSFPIPFYSPSLSQLLYTHTLFFPQAKSLPLQAFFTKMLPIDP